MSAAICGHLFLYDRAKLLCQQNRDPRKLSLLKFEVSEKKMVLGFSKLELLLLIAVGWISARETEAGNLRLNDSPDSCFIGC